MIAVAIEIARDIRAALSTGAICAVTFCKIDGEVTERYITRNQEYIPNDKRPKYVKAEDPHYIVAFDTEKNGWIRFHESKAIEWSVTRI